MPGLGFLRPFIGIALGRKREKKKVY